MTKAQREARMRTKPKRKGHKPRKGKRLNPAFLTPFTDDQLIDMVFTNAVAAFVSALVPMDVKRQFLQSANAVKDQPTEEGERSAETK